ncbi:MAG: hypothetical protein LUQ54_03435 [Methanoregula sp.]|nr:hypothetical protein [Methanoregula sp.]
MSLMKSSLIPPESRTKPQRNPVRSVQPKAISSTGLYHGFRADTNQAVQGKLSEKYLLKGMEVSSRELDELRIFNTFMVLHVRPNNIRDVPCMFLWAEWVRFCLKDKHTFPEVILEQEFRDLVINKFGFDVAQDEVWGPVYPGMQFISQKNFAQNVSDREPVKA